MNDGQDPDTLAHDDRREDYAKWRAKVDQRLDEGAATMQALNEAIKANTETTNQTHSDTTELVTLLNSFRGAFRVLEMLGKLAKPLGYIVALIGGVMGIVTIVKGGGVPK